MAQRRYEYDGMIHEVPDSGGAYVLFPWNIREEFGKGRVKVHAEFDGIPYDGSIVNMGVKDEDGNVCYIIGLLKSIRNQLGKGDRDSVHVDRTAQSAGEAYIQDIHPFFRCFPENFDKGIRIYLGCFGTAAIAEPVIKCFVVQRRIHLVVNRKCQRAEGKIFISIQ